MDTEEHGFFLNGETENIFLPQVSQMLTDGEMNSGKRKMNS